MIARQPAQNVPLFEDMPGPSYRLSLSFLSVFLVIPISSQNAYKMRTKCDQKRRCEFFNASAIITYDFNTVKCTHFPRRRGRALFLGERARVRDRLVFALPASLRPTPFPPLRLGNSALNPSTRSGNLFVNYCTESSESAHSPIFYRCDDAVPSNYANQNRRTPILLSVSKVAGRQSTLSPQIEMTHFERRKGGGGVILRMTVSDRN